MITTFFIDLWNDLREKRLWPIAVGAVAATLAIPVLLLKPASDGGTPIPTPSGSPSGGAAPRSSGGGGSSSGSATVTQQTTSWIYTATFKFGTPGHMKTIKDAKPFTMLPDETTPTLIYASAGADGKSAIFYIQDPNFQAAGEGKCNAPGAKCRFVTLQANASHDEETFLSSDGATEYDVQLLSIGRKTISDSNSSSSKPSSAPKGKKATGAAKKRAKASNLDFLPVLLGFSSTKQRRVVHHK